ncbi:MAG: SusC/RagA family TonB-linked outer membrane protein [Prevotella sp.]|nr:SusC/RagA family TonB-linked outer membrane protein [Prevotella sp.]
MEKRLSVFLATLLLCVCTVMAQTKVSGTVLSQDDGQPIIGAAVQVEGTTIGMLTDVNGRFSLTLPQGKTQLRVSYVGMTAKTVTAKNGIRVFLASDASVLQDVVVTALGISRQQKTLGYSATTLKADDVIEGHRTDVTSALAGKVAGLQISSTSGDPGQANSVVIRGFSSINGSNQPLYVVDGVPLQNTTFDASTQLANDQGYMNALGGISNVNPDDIESMTVLKGAAATALYGSRAANGAIIITTKTGKKGDGRNFSISYTGSIQTRSVVDHARMQNKFGQGWDGQQTYIENGSWGPEMDGSTQVFGPIWNNQQLIHQYSPVKNNFSDFFDTGVSTSHSISLSGVSQDQKTNYYLSYSYTGDNGIMPGNKDTYHRNTISARTSYEATKWLKLSSSFNLAKANTNTVGTYQGLSVIDGLNEYPRDISIVDMKDLSSAFHTPEAYYTPYGITNPYWALANNYNHNDSKQVYGKIQADINPIKQLTLTYRFGFDYTDYDLKVGTPQIELDDALISSNYATAPSYMNTSGSVFSRYLRKYETNHDFIANWKDKYLDQKLDVNVNVGLNLNERYSTAMNGQTDNLTFYTGYWQLNNGSTKSTIAEGQSKRRLVGLFGDVTLGWDDTVYLELTARRDWSSTLPLEKNSYFYPGATLSWIFSNQLPKNDILSFGKLRLAYGKTGNDADPYYTAARYVQAYANGYYTGAEANFPLGGVNAFQSAATIGSTSLKPEMTTEFEVGLNAEFLKGRIGLDFAFYNRVTSDQIFDLPVDPATGYQRMVTNFGKVRNRGIELLVNTTPVKVGGFRWDLSFNFARNWNKVLSLPESLEGGRVAINAFGAGNNAMYMYAEAGQPIGTIYTYAPLYTEDGKQIVGEDGQPLLSSELTPTGKNMNHKWTGGVTTAFSYKGVSLSAALDIRKGGYMFSRTRETLTFVGNSVITMFNDRRPFVVPNSVVSDGNGGYVENTTPIYLTDDSFQTFYNDYGAGEGGECYLVDRSFVKLRNITLSWQLPKAWVSKIYLSDVTVSAFCNNVFTWTAKSNHYIDPEASSYGNDLAGAFGELYSNPACRVFGCNLSVKF